MSNKSGIKLTNLKPKSSSITNSKQDIKTKTNSHVSNTIAAQKRPLSSNKSSLAIKKTKLNIRDVAATDSLTNFSINTKMLTSSSITVPKLLNIDFSWMEFAADIDVNEKTFEAAVNTAKEKNKPNKMARTICAAIKNLLTDTDQINHNEFVSKILLAIKEEERLMKSSNVFLALLSLLNALNSSQSAIQINLIITLITQMTELMDNWPLAAVNYCLNDSLGSRNWVDKPNAAQLLQCICSLFGYLSFPSEQSFLACDLIYVQRQPYKVVSKFNKSTEEIFAATKSVCDFFEKQSEPTKNTLKTLALCSGNPKIRNLAAKKLDSWLQNGKLQRQAIELLLYIASNTSDLFLEDNLETLLCLVSLRALRSKQILNVFQVALKDILSNCSGSCSVLITLIMDNELSSIKHSHNMNILQFIYNYNFNEASEVIAKYVIKKLENLDCVVSVRMLLRDFVRSSVRTEFSFCLFAKAMCNTFCSYVTQNPSHLQNFLFLAFVDVCAMLPFLGITPLIKEAVNSKNKSNNQQQTTASSGMQDCLSKFYSQLQEFMLNALQFLKWVSQFVTINNSFYVKAYYILFYLGNYSFYTSAEKWPNELEFNQLMKVIAECPIEQNFLKELIELPNLTTQNLSLSTNDILVLLELITKRTLSIRGFECEKNSLLVIKSPQIIESLFNLSLYKVEDSSITTPLAVRSLYWKVWFLATIWSCLNRHNILKNLYEKFPTIRMAFYMIITRDYQYPVIKLNDIDGSQFLINDLKEIEIEQNIFKTLNLSESAFNENNSSLSNNSFTAQNIANQCNLLTVPPICLFNPTGMARRPSNFFIDCLKQCNEQYSLYNILSSIRNPDILQHILKDQGSEKTIPAVIQLLLNNSSAIYSIIPLLSLCQIALLITEKRLGFKSQFHQFFDQISSFSEDLQNQIFSYIRFNLFDNKSESTVETVKTIIKFFFEKLGSLILSEREATTLLLNNLLTFNTNYSNIVETNQSPEPDTTVFLLKDIRYFTKLKNEICEMISKCCIVENKIQKLLSYIQFIIEHAEKKAFHSISLFLSNLVERSLDNSNKFKKMHECLIKFYAHFIRMFEKNNDFSDCLSNLTSKDNLLHIFIKEPKMELKLDAQIVSDIMKLLSEGFCSTKELNIDEQDETFESREYLTKIFFPIDDSKKQIIVSKESDHNQIVDILPLNLKQKMLSAQDERIVKVALEGVTSEQALTFLQSFALSSFSCSQLLNILNNSELGKSEKALSAIPFVRAYKLKGADGCNLFLANMDKFLNTNKTEEKKNMTVSYSNKKIIKINNMDSVKQDFLTECSATEYLNKLIETCNNCVSTEKSEEDKLQIFDKQIIISNTFQDFLNTLELKACNAKSSNENLQYVKAILNLIIQKIQIFIISLSNTLISVLFVLMHASLKNNAVQTLLTNFVERIEKVCPNACFVSSILHQYNIKQSLSFNISKKKT